MAYDEVLATRVREALEPTAEVTERKMFGGLAFMVAGNMCCGVVGEELMVRVGPEAWEAALAAPHTREMDFTGRSMRGMVYVAPAGLVSDPDLEAWVGRGVAFAASLPKK